MSNNIPLARNVKIKRAYGKPVRDEVHNSAVMPRAPVLGRKIPSRPMALASRG